MRTRPKLSAASLTASATTRGENVDLSNLLRLEGVARRAIAFMRQLAREVRGEAQPTLTLEEHLATFAGVEPRQAREAAGRGGATPSPRHAPGGRRRARQRASCDDEEG